MPGVFQLSVDEAVQEAAAAKAEGVAGVLLFGLPEHKDADRIAGRRTRTRRCRPPCARSSASVPDLLVMTDVCLCEYTSHGHCGIVDGDEIVNDADRRAAGAGGAVARRRRRRLRGAVRHDGRPRRRDPPGARRRAASTSTGIMSYAAKYCSGFYGPFREAADSTPQFGDRRSHQMDPANVEEALREVEIDIAEGADIVMVKPALPYLDVLRQGEGRGSATRPPRTT